MCGILLNLRSLPRLGSDVDGARLADNLCFDGHAVGHARVFLPKGVFRRLSIIIKEVAFVRQLDGGESVREFEVVLLDDVVQVED